ncbi:hypothetical protein [Streptomyces sp. NPDC020917]|uniref:hypothetical protein n=1 Tax=Streptomyces sp. NPDC020917 TaxID=3365102 RepID=UPI0037A445B9
MSEDMGSDAAAAIRESASLINVLLGEVAVVRGPASHYNPGPANVSINSEGSFHRQSNEATSSGVVICKDEYVAQLRNADDESIAEIKASFVAAFSVETEDAPSETDLDEFAGSTGKLVIRPYAREFIHQMSTRLGVPALTLEVLHFKGTVLPEEATQVRAEGLGT